MKFTGYNKDVNRFLSDIKVRAEKCRWKDILTIGAKNLLASYGQIEVQDLINERDARDMVVPTTLTEARPKINALMMFYFIFNYASPCSHAMPTKRPGRNGWLGKDVVGS